MCSCFENMGPHGVYFVLTRCLLWVYFEITFMVNCTHWNVKQTRLFSNHPIVIPSLCVYRIYSERFQGYTSDRVFSLYPLYYGLLWVYFRFTLVNPEETKDLVGICTVLLHITVKINNQHDWSIFFFILKRICHTIRLQLKHQYILGYPMTLLMH